MEGHWRFQGRWRDSKAENFRGEYEAKFEVPEG